MNLPAGYNPRRSVSAVIVNTVKFIQLNWKPLLVAYGLICTLFLVPGYVFDLLYPPPYSPRTASHHVSLFDTERLKYQGIHFLISMIGDTAFAATVLWFVRLYLQNGVAPTAKQVWDSFKLLYLSYYIAFALIYIMVLFSFGLLLIPGFFMMPFAGLMVTIMVFERATFTTARPRSWALIEGRWELIMVVFYCCLLAVIIPAVAMLIFNKLSGPLAAPNETVRAIRLLLGYFFRCFTAIPLIGVAFFYMSIKTPAATLPVIDELDELTPL